MLRHVIDACDKAAYYTNRFSDKSKISVSIAVLCPEGDPIVSAFESRVKIIEGPEEDVLARYKLMTDQMKADFIVRVTADCPLIPPFLIGKHIKVATKGRYDYVSNVDEQIRTSADGLDCEVISRPLLNFTFENATDPKDREHVTTFIRRNPPDWARTGHVIGFYDMSKTKISVDTPEELTFVREQYSKIKKACEKAERMHGKENLHRF